MAYKLVIFLSVVYLATLQVSSSPDVQPELKPGDDPLIIVTQELVNKAEQFQKALELKIAVLKHVATMTKNLVELNKLRKAGKEDKNLEETVLQEMAKVIPEAIYYINFQEEDLGDARVVVNNLKVAYRELKEGRI